MESRIINLQKKFSKEVATISDAFVTSMIKFYYGKEIKEIAKEKSRNGTLSDVEKAIAETFGFYEE